jgi:hypothetical protein
MIQSFYKSVFVDKNYSIETIENQLPYLSFYLAIAFLIKFRYYWATIIFIIPLYFELSKAYNFILTPKRIILNVQLVNDIIFTLFDLLIIIHIFIDWKRNKSKI